MEDFMTLLKRGVIYDGCPIVTKGTIRVKNGEVSIDTNHNQMVVGGKNFAALCEPGKYMNEQGDVLNVDELPEAWRAKIEELTAQNEHLAQGMKKNVESLQLQIQQERELRTSFEETLAIEKRVSEEATQVISEMKSKLSDEMDKVQSLKEQLDSAGILLEEKEEKLRELQLLLADKDRQIQMYITREKEALMLSEELKNQVALLEEERTLEKKNSAVLLEDFNEWRTNSEEEISELKKQLEQCKSTITTLKNELEVAELEDDGYQSTIAALQKENEHLKHETEHAQPQDTPAKLRSQRSLRALLKGISKPKEKDTTTKENKGGWKDKRSSVASAPSL